MSEVRINLAGLNRLRKHLPQHRNRIEKAIAMKTPENVIAGIDAGMTGIFPANRLPPNAPSTIKRKGHDKQLLEDGVLLETGTWQIDKHREGWVVAPPIERQRASFYLHTGVRGGKKYKFMEIPKGYFPSWATRIIRSYFKRIIKKYQ